VFKHACRAFSSKARPSPKNILTMSCLKDNEIQKILNTASEMKQDPDAFSETMKNETLLMLFAKPSLRTRISF